MDGQAGPCRFDAASQVQRLCFITDVMSSTHDTDGLYPVVVGG